MTAMTITNLTPATATPEGTPAMIACNSCATALVNADTSHIDERDRDTVTQNIEGAGLLVLTHCSENAIFDCDFCEYGFAADAYKFETV